MTPLVSIVLTTRHRPRLVARAVSSALAQSVRDVEVIVVVDGPDPETVQVLEGIVDARLRVHVRPERGGQPAAINSGVRLARAAWTAMLDDDDEWLPEKLEVQLRAAETSPYDRPVVGGRFVARSETGDAVWPLRAPTPGERACEYLFCRSRLAFGEGIVPTSVLFAPTELFRDHSMNEALHKHCDLDWLVRIDRLPDVALALPAATAPLAIWQRQGGRERLSNVHDWRFSHSWITSSRSVVTARAYAGFLLTWVSLSARAQGDLAALPFLLKEAFRRGRPGSLELAVYAAVWGLPMGLRDRMSHGLSRRAMAA